MQKNWILFLFVNLTPFKFGILGFTTAPNNLHYNMFMSKFKRTWQLDMKWFIIFCFPLNKMKWFLCSSLHIPSDYFKLPMKLWFLGFYLLNFSTHYFSIQANWALPVHIYKSHLTFKVSKGHPRQAFNFILNLNPEAKQYRVLWMRIIFLRH